MRFCAAILIWIAAGLPLASGQAKRPVIAFDRVTMDAGTVTQGEIAKRVYTFTNKGTGTLDILRVQPT